MPALSNEDQHEIRHEVNGGMDSNMKKELKIELSDGANGGSNGENNEVEKLHPFYSSSIPSIFTSSCHPLVEAAARDVDGYYLQHWGFDNEKAKEKFLAARLSLFSCLCYPKALDERIRHVCSLLTYVFLIDGEYRNLHFRLIHLSSLICHRPA